MSDINAYKEVVNGNSTEWKEADFANDPEVGTYFVHNYSTQKHEKFESLSAAKSRFDAITAQFNAEFPQGVEAKLLADKAQPLSTGTQTL